MSAKVLHSITDENPDLHKHVGCMNGVFQLFNRRHYLTGRRISSHNHKRLSPGQSDNHGMELDSTMQKTTETSLDEVKEKRRVSVESSRTSFSSSCSSTFSSVDCNKTAKPELSSLGHSNFVEIPSQILPQKQPLYPSHLSQQSLDLRDVVKDSINREGCGLSVKTMAKPERENNVLKHIDSPRPLQPSKPVKLKVSGLDGSFPLKDTHRFSYDGRESRDKWKSSIKLKQTPRLSLDSRESSIRRSAAESRSNYLLDDLEQQRNVKSSQILDPQQEPGSNNSRTSGLVAKLMGLEAFPEPMAANHDQIWNIKCCPDEDLDAMSTTSKKADESKRTQVSSSPRTPQRKPASSPRPRNIDSVSKPKPGFPLEQAPRRKTDGNVTSEKPAFDYREAQVQTKAQNPCSSIYGGIEKRLLEMEFKTSAKDLRVLKQILDAMRKTRESLKEASDLEPQTSNHSTNYSNLDQNSMSTMEGSQQSIHLTNPPLKIFKSSGVLIKEAKFMQKTRNSCSSVIPIEGMSGLRKLRTSGNANNKRDTVEKRSPNDLTPRNCRFREPSCQPLHSMDKSSNAKACKSIQTSKAPQNTSRGDPTSTGRSLTTVSPRLHKKKNGLEKPSRPTTHISDSSRSRRHLSKQQIESGSPSRKSKPKSLIELSCEASQLSHQSDAISVQSESNISTASQTDIEVTSIDRSNEIHGAYQHEGLRNKIEARLREETSKAETTTAMLEQPSPVSVLDTTFYREGSPSPVKKTSNAFKDESQEFDEAEWNSEDLQDLLSSTGTKPGLVFSQEKTECIEHLVHTGQVNSTQDKPATDHVSSLCAKTNPEHKYISEILLASGFLVKGLVSSSSFIQLHPSCHLINPKLFLILEQTKRRIELSDNERTNEKIDQSKFREAIHRKLIFDTVNEILVLKLSSANYSESHICPSNLVVKSLTGHKLLKEVCSEVDQLHAKPNCSEHDKDDGSVSIFSQDMMYQTHIAEAFHSEIPGLVLDIERLIFKDLISEVVSGEVAGMPVVHCKRLFPD